MLEKIKKFLTFTQDDRKLIEAEQGFDELMKQVDADTDDLTKLEGHLRAQFEKIQGDVDDIREGVDEVVG